MIENIYKSNSLFIKWQIADLRELAREKKEPIHALIDQVILITIDPKDSEENVQEKIDTGSKIYTENAKKWFEHRYIMTPRTKEDNKA
jgi:hypothetical protein